MLIFINFLINANGKYYNCILINTLKLHSKNMEKNIRGMEFSSERIESRNGAIDYSNGDRFREMIDESSAASLRSPGI